MAAPGSVLINQSVGEALRFVRENVRFIALVAALGAGGATLLSGAIMGLPALGVIGLIASGFLQALVYAAFTAAVLYGAGAVPPRLVGDGLRVWAAMAILGFFLFIVFTVISIPVLITMFAGPLAPYTEELAAAGQDQAAVMSVMTRFAEENPTALLAVALFYCAIWILLTSRLYLAAPASVDQGRVRVFDTWKWTKGAMLRIVGARLLLLLPANIFVGALGYLIGRGLGIDTMNMGAMASAAAANPIGTLAYTFMSGFLTLALFSALEAGLSASLYRGLRPQSS